jgi:hypothetical protein
VTVICAFSILVSAIAALTLPTSFFLTAGGDWGDLVQRTALRQPVLGKMIVAKH